MTAAERPSSDALLLRLERDLAARSSALVAFSGGVDSSVVAALARRALGARSLAVTAAAETLAGRELDHARRAAAEIGIDHRVVTYSELDSREFRDNPTYRCYVCQGMRMGTMRRLAADLGFATVCDGTNASDPGPNRPGLAAVREQGVYSPLLAHGVDKAATRELARALGLSVWDRPANACLSSRIPHGQTVTLGKLRRIEAAEDLLQDRGFCVVRVRSDRGRARVEVGPAEVARLRRIWTVLVRELRALGFVEAILDPRGYRSGGADLPAPEAERSPLATAAAEAGGG
ncbi:MAG TPA: ATP-dependent sacrificial sulfur transferase LarE [Thermoanaerobaculia bacterium]|nr:ATP-dependent sacrificial sulfur transferase LarE [Thermoanaerobaculia bacterium]